MENITVREHLAIVSIHCAFSNLVYAAITDVIDRCVPECGLNYLFPIVVIALPKTQAYMILCIIKC